MTRHLLAESGNKFLVYLAGRDAQGAAFSDLMFVMGGMGARLVRDGLHCMSFPANSSNLPTEVLEQALPLRVRRRALRPDSGGPGRFRGGAGQTYELESLSPFPLTVRAEHGKLATAPLGLRGGLPGAAGGVFLNDQPVADKVPLTMNQGDVLRLEVPGGGGMYPPHLRDAAGTQARHRGWIGDARGGSAGLWLCDGAGQCRTLTAPAWASISAEPSRIWFCTTAALATWWSAKY